MERERQYLTPNGYKPRLIEKRLDLLMHGFGCVEITGAKWCGKTWTALSRSASVTKLDVKSEREAAQIDPSLALAGEIPHLIDEWQEVPEVWDAARRFVDDSGNQRGQLLLTGSTSLQKIERDRVRHSGAGRIARITMRPMSLAETENSSAKVSLESLFDNGKFSPIRQETKLSDIARWCCRGGWPANLGLNDDVAMSTAEQYLESVLHVNVTEEGQSPELALALMRALALNESQAVTYKTLSNDAGQIGSKTDSDTIASYLDFFNRIYLMEELRGWEPPMRAKARVRIKPKRYFVDPSLAAALLGATPERLLHDTQTLGMLFENLVIRDLRIYLSTYAGIDNNLYYYRDEKGLEVDVIAEHAAQWAGIEIKLSDMKVESGAKNLLRLRDKVLSNPAAHNAEPAFLAIIVGAGNLAYQRDDGVYVLPITTLGA